MSAACRSCMGTQNSCLYTCIISFLTHCQNCVLQLIDTTSKPFLLFPIIAGWPQKKQFKILSSADSSTCLSEAAVSSVVLCLILLAICCILQCTFVDSVYLPFAQAKEYHFLLAFLIKAHPFSVRVEDGDSAKICTTCSLCTHCH